MNMKYKVLVAFAGLLLLSGTAPAWARGGGGGHGAGGGGMGPGGTAVGNMGGFSNDHQNNQQDIEERTENKGAEGAEQGKHLGQGKNVTRRPVNAGHRATPAVPATPANPTPGTPGAMRATPATPAVPPTPY
jgi:hypothetical protein